MFKEMYQLARKAGYSGFCIAPTEEMEYSFTSREDPAAAPIPAWKVRWFSLDDNKFVIHTAITDSNSVADQLRCELLYEYAPGPFIETILSAANKVKRTKASGLSATTFAARFYGLDGTQAEKFASLLELAKAPATVTVVPHGGIVQAYRDCSEWSVSCMTSRSSRVEIYDSSTDCAMLIIQRGEEKMGRVLIFRPRELSQWTRSREDTLDGTNPDLTGWYYTRVYGRGLSCGFVDPEGENYTRRAIEAIGCRSGTMAPAGAVVCLRSINDRAPWFDAYCGAELWYDGAEGRQCVVSFNDTAPDWVKGDYSRWSNDLEGVTFSGAGNDGIECCHCGNRYHEDDMSYVDGVGDICSSCLDDEYTWVDETGSYESNESVALHCYDSRNVLADDYVPVERPHMDGCWVCDSGDEVEICGSTYYGPDIESGRVEVLAYRLVPKEVGVELHLQIRQERNVSSHWMDMEIDGTSVKVGVDYDVNSLMLRAGGSHVLKAPLFGRRDESFYATLWRVEEDCSRVQRLLTKFGSYYPLMVDTEWVVVASTARSNTWCVGDKLGRYIENRTHSWSTLIVDGVAYTILSDRRSTMIVSSCSSTAGPRIINGDRPFAFQYMPGAVSDIRYDDVSGHYYLTGDGQEMCFNLHATTCNGYDVVAYASYYGNSTAHGVIFNNHLVRVSHLGMSAEQVVRRLSRLDNTCLAYAVTGSIEDLKNAILNQLTASENA